MLKIDIDKIEEIRLCWDYEVAIIPQSYVKKLKYEGIITGDDKIAKYTTYECDYVYLELDKKYLEEHYYFEGNNFAYYKENNIESDSTNTIYEALNNFNVWNIEIVYKDDNYVCLCLPSKTVSDAWSKNTLEQHKEKDNILKIRWATPGALEDIRKRKKKHESKSN